jgi:hypothetical protein
VNFFEHFSSHLSKDGNRLDRWCKNIGIQKKLRVGIDGNDPLAGSEVLGIEWYGH